MSRLHNIVTVVTTIRLPETVKDKLDKLAEREDRSFNYYVNEILREHVQRKRV